MPLPTCSDGLMEVLRVRRAEGEGVPHAMRRSVTADAIPSAVGDRAAEVTIAGHQVHGILWPICWVQLVKW